MRVIEGTVPHAVKVQMGAEPDPLRDGNAVVYLPLDESAEGVGAHLAGLAIAVSTANRTMNPGREPGVITSVDGTACRIPLPEIVDAEPPEALSSALAKLVAPTGWQAT